MTVKTDTPLEAVARVMRALGDVGDTVDRERLFLAASLRLDVEYEELYQAWLHTDNWDDVHVFPMPGDVFEVIDTLRLQWRTVIASCYYRELTESDHRQAGDDWPDTVYLVMLLNPEAPFYTVAHVSPAANAHGLAGWNILGSQDFRNINEATENYADSGGDI